MVILEGQRVSAMGWMVVNVMVRLFLFSSTPIYHMIGHIVPYDTLLTPSGRITNSLSQRLAAPAWAQSASVITRVAELTIPWKAGRIWRVARHEDVACSVVYKPLIYTQRH